LLTVAPDRPSAFCLSRSAPPINHPVRTSHLVPPPAHYPLLEKASSSRQLI
jgi:hypothetical protein